MSASSEDISRGFWSGQRGGATIGAVLAISILVSAFGSLMGIVHKVYTEDRMERGVRAGARALSLAASAPANEKALEDIICKGFEREFGEDEAAACRCWQIEVETFENPRTLSGGLARVDGASLGGENKDMVLVRVRRPWGLFPVASVDDADSDSDSEADQCPDASGGIVVTALARNEREVLAP